MTTCPGHPASARAPRLGLCCTFLAEPIRFRTTTAAYIGRLSRREGREKVAFLSRENALALREALAFCARSGIGSFRVLSQGRDPRGRARRRRTPSGDPRGR